MNSFHTSHLTSVHSSISSFNSVIVRMRPLKAREREAIVKMTSGDSLSMLGQLFSFDVVADRTVFKIYSRTPNPGPEFIEKYKLVLADFGYDPTKIKDTPQDCEVTDSQLAAMMSMKGMQKALTNKFPDLELKKSVQFNPLTSVFDTLKKLVQLYFK